MRRLVRALGVATAIATVLALLPFTTVPVAGQAPGMTAWGLPNLEGIWLDVYDTPFERAAELGDRGACDGRRAGRSGPGSPGKYRA